MRPLDDAGCYARFMERVHETEDGCWIWTGGRTKGGYGVYQGKRGRKNTTAHRISYLQFVGPIFEGMQIDHMCANRACVNPDHLDMVTPRENILRSSGSAARFARRTHCDQGHKYSSTNTYVTSEGARVCKACRAAWMRQWKMKQEAAA